MRDDPLPGAEEALALLRRAAELGVPMDEEMAAIVAALAEGLPVLRRQEWGRAVQREQGQEEAGDGPAVEAG